MLVFYCHVIPACVKTENPKIYQRGLSDPQNGGVVQMFPECECPHWLQLDSVSNGRLHSRQLSSNEGTYA